jgi:LysM repeat protein
MASAAGPSLGGPASRNEGPPLFSRRGAGPFSQQAHASDWSPAEMAVSVPELVGPLHLPRHVRSRREWATSRRRYRVRVGWHTAHVSDNLLDLLLLVDGRHTVAEITDELERRQERQVHVAEVAYLLRERLGAAGLVRLRRGRPVATAPQSRAFTAATASLELAPPTSAAPAPSPALQTLDSPDAAPSEAPTVVMPLTAAVAAPTTVPVMQTAAAVPDLGHLQEEEETQSRDVVRAQGESTPAQAAPAAGASAVKIADHPAAASTDEPAAEAEAIPDDEPTLVLPRDDTHALAPGIAQEGALHPRAAAFSAATLAGANTRSVIQRAAPITRQLPAPSAAIARMRSGVSRQLILQVGGIVVLVFLLGLAVHGNLAGLFHANNANVGAVRRAPTVAPTATPLQERILSGETAYTVHSGDTLDAIAAREHVSAGALALVNADVVGSSGASSALAPGMRLAIPAIYQPGVPASRQPRPLYYTLRPGDTLYQVGQLFGVDWHTIATYNHITNQYSMPVGLGLIIPAQS